MRLLIIGANGLLGSNVVSEARSRGLDVVGTYHSERPSFDISLHQLDLRERDRIASLVDRVEPEAVVNCAALTDVDGCEADPERARAINAAAPGELAAICDGRETAFLHVSTDYVFDGRAEEPYPETAIPNPIQAYGETKLDGERAVSEAAAGALLVRLSFVYGVHRGTNSLAGFPAWVRDRLDAGEDTPLFTDQHVTPSRAGQAAATMLDLLELDANGTYHVACRSCVTPYEFGDEIRTRMGVSRDLIARGSQADVDRLAERPRSTCLDVSTVESELGRPQPTLSEDLDAIADVLSGARG